MATLSRVETAPAKSKSTLSALKNANFRMYFIGQLVSISGTWMQNIAQSYLVFSITRSELWLGLVACAAGLPILLMAPIGGVIVERFPRRNLLFLTQAMQMILAFILTALTVAGTVQVWHIVVLALLLGVTSALDNPARQSFVVELVGHDDLHSGIALNSIMNSSGRVLGPVAAGIALVKFGTAWCFMINALSFIAVLFSLFILKVPYPVKYTSSESPLRQLREGFNFSRRDPLIAPLLLLATIASLFVLPMLRLLPAYADVVLHSPEEGYAAVSAAEGIGAVMAGIAVGWLSLRFGHSRLIIIAIIVSSLSMIMLALQSAVAPAVLITFLFGLSMVTLFVNLNTMVQTVVPDNFRGRVLGIYSLVMFGLAPFGALAIGAFAEEFGTSQAIALSGVVMLVLGAVIFMRWPILLHQRHSSERIETLAEVPVAAGD